MHGSGTRRYSAATTVTTILAQVDTLKIPARSGTIAGRVHLSKNGNSMT
jgi:hypothetical protein